jgi:protein-tyrosine phosphatase
MSGKLGLAGSLLLVTWCAVCAPLSPTSPPHQRHVPLEGAANFRDLGGYRTADGRSVKWGLLYRSDALNALTDNDLRYVVALNIRRVVDFRTLSEASSHPDRLPEGLLHESVPVPLQVPTPDLTHVGDQGALDQMAERAWLTAIDHVLATQAYPSFVRDSTSSYRLWIQGLLSASPGAQIFHCTGGADRTGFASAILLLALGVPKDIVIRDYLLTNRYLFSARGRAFLDKRTPVKLPTGLRMHARYLDAALAEIEKEYGSFDGYLRDGLGLDSAGHERLRAKYLE